MGKQLSNNAIRERLRKHAPDAVDTLVKALNSRSPNASMGAAKTILSKFVPDLKATDITSGGEKISPISLLEGLTSVPANNSNTQDTKTE